MSARTTHRLTAGLAAIGLLAITTACTGNAGSGGGGGDTLYVGTVNPPASFNPINQSDVGGQFAVRFAMDTLLDQPEPLKFVPKLADSIESKDNKTFTVKLHAGAKWSDGQPITAKDVVYTINLIANRDSLTTLGGNVTALTGVDATGKLPKGQAAVPGLTAPNDTTVVFTTKTPVDPNYVKEMIGTKVVIMPEHTLGEDRAGADRRQQVRATSRRHERTVQVHEVHPEREHRVRRQPGLLRRCAEDRQADHEDHAGLEPGR